MTRTKKPFSKIIFCVLFCCIGGLLYAQQNQTKDCGTQWIASALKEIETVRVGMTRTELLKVFQEEGGRSTRERKTYAYRLSPYIKVDVTFTPVGETSRYGESPDDKISKISKPYLAWSVMD